MLADGLGNRQLDLLFAEAAGAGGERGRPGFLWQFGHNIDCGEDSVVAIKRGGWAADDLNLFDQAHFDREIHPEPEHGIEDMVSHVMAVDHDQKAGAVVPRQVDPGTPMVWYERS